MTVNVLDVFQDNYDFQELFQGLGDGISSRDLATGWVGSVVSGRNVRVSAGRGVVGGVPVITTDEDLEHDDTTGTNLRIDLRLFRRDNLNGVVEHDVIKGVEAIANPTIPSVTRGPNTSTDNSYEVAPLAVEIDGSGAVSRLIDLRRDPRYAGVVTMEAMPLALIRRAASQALAVGDTDPSFDTEDEDQADFWSASAANQFIIPYAGFYRVRFSWETALDTIIRMPLVDVRRAAAQSIATGAAVAGNRIIFDTENADLWGYWTSGTPAQITIPTGYGGPHLITGLIDFGANSSGTYRRAELWKNGAVIASGAAERVPVGAFASLAFSYLDSLAAAGDFYYLMAEHDAGVNINISDATLQAIRQRPVGVDIKIRHLNSSNVLQREYPEKMSVTSIERTLECAAGDKIGLRLTNNLGESVTASALLGQIEMVRR